MSEAVAPFVPPAQPLLATDVAAYVLFALAVLYAALWLRDREEGMSWLAGAFGVLGLFWATNRWSMPVAIHVTHPGWNSVPVLGVALLQVGLVRYLGLAGRARRMALALLLALPLAAAVLLGVSVFVPVPRGSTSPLVTFSLFGCTALSFWQARREPGAGHGFVGLALLSIPVLTIGALFTGADVVLVRYLAPLPVIFFGLVLLTVSLLRRRKALEVEVARRGAAEAALAALNAALEQQVAQRTADLQDMVTALESFNRSVSHDLRGPLGGIAGLARLAEEGLARGDPAPALRMLPLIRRQSESSTQLVSALLELARVGDAPMQRQSVDLGELARDVAQSLRVADAGPVQVDVDTMATAEADPALLRAVFTNLIGNGLKFCAERADGRVVVSSREEPGAVIIEVADNGAGFDEAAAATLFKPFQRLHGARFEGHGVGLSIVRRAVERHGGRVWAQGRPGAGATFSFSLPRASA